MNQNTNNLKKVQKLTLIALLTALVVILQILGGFIRIGTFSVSLVLVPIVLGAALLGPWAGGWLGLVFGAVVLISGDAAWFMGMNLPGTDITVLLKGTVAGLVSGAVYRLIEKKNRTAAMFTSAALCPIINTALFFCGCYLFFFEGLTSAAASGGQTLLAYIIIVLIGGNFIFELVFNLVLAPVILRLIDVGKKMLGQVPKND